jgi:hypothetical protein
VHYENTANQDDTWINEKDIDNKELINSFTTAAATAGVHCQDERSIIDQPMQELRKAVRSAQEGLARGG